MDLNIDLNYNKLLTKTCKPFTFNGESIIYAEISDPNIGLSDFNIFVKRGLSSEVFRVMTGQISEYINKRDDFNFSILYCNFGEIIVSSNLNFYILKDGETCILETPEEFVKIEILSKEYDYFLFKI